jgi:hypothetical protein
MSQPEEMGDRTSRRREVSNLDRYRGSITRATREAGEQAALSFAREWADVGWDALVDLARSGRHFSADDLVAEVGPAPSPGAIGALIRQASRTGLIEAIGYQTSKRVSRHDGLQRVWVGNRVTT